MTFGDLLSVIVRVTLLAATGSLLCFILRKASAAKRHLTAMATLMALVAFPVAKAVLPALPVPILPAAMRSAPLRSDAAPIAWVASTSGHVVPGGRGAGSGVGSAAPDSPGRRLAGFAIVLSLAVSSAFLFYVLISCIAAAVTVRRARRIHNPALRWDVESACRRLGVSRTVDIRESSSVTVPVVWGLFRPVLLLPVEARDWSRERLRVVFLHEVAHVARHDGMGLLLARIATSVFWFHPLVWKLARIARRECERCCDDLVLATGERAADYAEHLLAIVRSTARRDRLADLAPALAQRSNLESRLASILRAGQRRDSVSMPRLVATIAFATLMLGATTAVRVVAAPHKADAPADVVEEPSPSPDRASEQERRAVDGALKALQVEVPDASSSVVLVAGPYHYNLDDDSPSGVDLLRAGHYAQAIAAFQEEVRKTGSVNAMYNIACAYSLRGDKQRAFDALENAIENGFDQTRHMTEDEDLRLLQGDAHFYKLVRLAKDLELFTSGPFGSGMKDEEDWRHSLSRFERVTREHPEVGRAWANLGFARLEAGDPKGGMAAYQKALDLGYQKPLTLYNLACCAARAGAIDQAFEMLGRADQAGFEIGEHVGSDSDLDALRGDPRYGAMLDRWDQKMAKEHRDKEKVEEKQKTD